MLTSIELGNVNQHRAGNKIMKMLDAGVIEAKRLIQKLSFIFISFVNTIITHTNNFKKELDHFDQFMLCGIMGVIYYYFNVSNSAINLIVYTLLLATLISLTFNFIRKKSRCIYIGAIFILNIYIKRLLGFYNQNESLETFYKNQANIYDDTRHWLLPGRVTMIKLCAAQLTYQKNLQTKNTNNNNTNIPLIWVDIGGGTGWMIERMNNFFPIDKFDHIYLIDITPSLLKVAIERFERLQWSNLTVVCANPADANFSIPGLENSKRKVTLVTMSHSLSMIDKFYHVIDRIQSILHPDMGFIGVCDYYVSSSNSCIYPNTSLLLKRKCNWFTRWFWQICFDDRVNLHSSRRDYLEYRFNTIKEYNGRYNFNISFLVPVPYYVWLGNSKHDFSTTTTTVTVNDYQVFMEYKDQDQKMINYCHNRPIWRLPYDATLKCHIQFKTYIFAYTWEDPREDLKVLELNPMDELLVITSAGDNVLNYLCHTDIKQIHSVDINPNQNHLLELKMAAISVLSYDDFWLLFGKGCHPDFSRLLDENLSPLLSSLAYEFWKSNNQSFRSCFYIQTGYTGYAVSVTQFLIQILGKTESVTRMCQAETIEEQERIYRTEIRSFVLNPWIINILSQPFFAWAGLGVPKNQGNMLKPEGTYYQYLCDSFDSIVSNYLLRNNEYFYLPLLMKCYTKDSCPSYLSEVGFLHLKTSAVLDTVKIYTSSILGVLNGMIDGSLSKAVLMDHMDWFDPKNQKDINDEIVELSRVMKKDGYILWRSCARVPWYNQIIINHGFHVYTVAVRQPGTNIPLDRVNTYASFYKGVKL